MGFSAQGLGELGLHVGFLHGAEGEVVLGGELDQKRARRRIEDRFGVHEQHAIGRLGLLQRGEDAGPEALQRRHVRERGDDLGRQRARGRRSGRRGGRGRCRRRGGGNCGRSRRGRGCRRGNPFRRGGHRSALRERDRLAVARRRPGRSRGTTKVAPYEGRSRRHNGRGSHDRGAGQLALQGFHTLGQSLQRHIGIGAHHARQRDLEGKPRVRGRLQLAGHIPQNAQKPRKTVDAEQRQLLDQFAPRRLGHVEHHLRPRHGHDVHVAHVLGQIRHELGHVGAGFHVLGHPAEARRRIAGAYRPHNVGQIRGVHSSQHPLGHFHGHRAVAEGDELLQRGERVAHAALGPVRDELERLPLELHVLGGANGAQPRHHGLGGDAAEIEALAARVNGLGHLLRIGGGQDEHHVARRLLQRLQKRVEGGRREHVHLVDDVYLVAPARRRELHAPDDLLADVLHAGAARGIQLVDVGVLAVGDHLAIVAGAVGLGRRPVLAQQRLGQ